MTTVVLQDPKGKKYHVIKCKLTFPRRARWTAAFDDAAHVIAQDLSIGKGYKLIIDELEYSCSIERAQNIDQQQSYCYLVAGNDGVLKLPKVKHLTGPTIRQVVQYLLSQAGETLSKNSDQELLSKRILNSATYSINESSEIWKQLFILLESNGAVARFENDGTVLVTRDKNPKQFVQPKDEWQKLINTSEGLDKFFVRTVGKNIPMPGMLDLSNQLIEQTTISISADETIVTTFNRDLTHQVTQFSKAREATINSYPASVITQLNNWRLKVRFADKNGPMGVSEITDVKIRNGSTLMTQRVKPGTRVSVNFDDPSHPFVDAFESAYTDKPLTSDTEAVYFGNPTVARSLARTNDGTITYLPQLWNATIIVPPLSGFLAGGPMSCVIKLGAPLGVVDMNAITSAIPPIPAPGQYKLMGLVKTGSKIVKSE